MQGREPGAWGYLAGQSVAATRRHLGRQLTDPERRMVWSRLWWWLEQLELRLAESAGAGDAGSAGSN